MDSNITSIHIPDHSVNTHYTAFNFFRFKKLKELTVGSECFKGVSLFLIYGLNELQLLKIENNSFTEHKNGYGNISIRSFTLFNCSKLESIEIGPFSFSDYAGGFELKNLPSLSSLIIGYSGSTSYNFYYSSFGIKGIITAILLLNRSSYIVFY